VRGHRIKAGGIALSVGTVGGLDQSQESQGAGSEAGGRGRLGPMTARRFPAPWTFEEHNDACFIVKDANGANVAYVYYEEERGPNDPRRSAANIAKLPDLLSRG
jgi:hypothetical protein